MWRRSQTSQAQCTEERKGDTRLRREQCGVFTPYKNCNIETLSRDYATVDEAVFSPCRAEQCRAEPSRAVNKLLITSHRLASLLPGNSYKYFYDARVGKGHVTASAVTSRVNSDATIKAFSRMSDPRVFRSSQYQFSTVLQSSWTVLTVHCIRSLEPPVACSTISQKPCSVFPC
jgi:hypothetical protein